MKEELRDPREPIRRSLRPMPDKFDELARYNSEVARGLVHTKKWKAKMAELQEEFNRWMTEKR